MKTIQVRRVSALIGCFVSLISACTLAQPLPTPTPTATPTAYPTPSQVPTIAPSPTLAPTPTPLVSLIPAELAGTDDMLYARDAPNTVYPVSRAINRAAPYTALARTPDYQWVFARFDDGFEGWLVYVPGATNADLHDLPVSGDSVIDNRIALVTADSIPFYTEAGDAQQDELGQGWALLIDQRTQDNAWLRGTDKDGRRGWIANNGVLLTFSVASLDITQITISVIPPPNARVRPESGGLRLRQLPSPDGFLLLNLNAGTELVVSERTADNAWVLVQLQEGYRGWVSAQYVEMTSGAITDMPINADPQPVPYFEPPTPVNAPQVMTVGGGARNIFQIGQSQGNRANIFTTVGDSLTDSAFFLRDIVHGYDLGQYGYLLPVINYFNADTGYGNAFARRAISAHAGWSTFSVVVEQRPELAGTCNPGELALDCEYRLVRPAYALIMIGTNDAPAFPADTYRANMTRIIEISIAHGVVPILSTLPPRGDFNDRILEYNGVIVQLAQQYGVPLSDLYTALVPLPNRGLAPDGIHLSEPPGGPAAALVFNSASLQYGATMRNLVTLQALAQVKNLVGY